MEEGESNEVSGAHSTNVGGKENKALDEYTFNGGGESNEVSDHHSVNVGGKKNKIVKDPNNNYSATYSFNGAGLENKIYGYECFNGSGSSNEVAYGYSFNGSGRENKSTGYASFNGGGESNTVSERNSFNGGGLNNTVSGEYSFNGGGQDNTASGIYSAIPGGQGLKTTADYSCAVGKYNKPGTIDNHERLFMVGYGSSGNRKNLFSVTSDGKLHTKAVSITGGGADFAEYFESSHDNIPIGTVVMIKDSMIEPSDDPNKSFGVISNTAAVLCNASTEWHGKYEKDEDGNFIYKDGHKVISKEFNPDLEYKTRSERPEWHIVGMVGRIKVLKGQKVNPNWIYLKKYSNKYDLYIVR